MTNDPAILGYAAGLIDGEGTISTNGRQWVGTRQCMPTVYIKVLMTDVRPIQWLHQQFGGVTRHVPARKATHKDAYYWCASPILAGEVLAALLPYLIVKRSQAEKAIALRALSGGRGSRLSPERLNAGLRIKDELRVLNRRGIPNTAIS